jgi:hypothetical protein
LTELVAPQLAAWESFYVIVGSSGAALIGLQFVVMTLIGGMRYRTNPATINAFGTPTVVHLAASLIVSATMSAPWPSLGPTSVAIAVCGLGGFTYSQIVIRRAHRQTGYKPVREDWVWYAILPAGIYAVLVVAAVLLVPATQVALFVIGTAALGLLMIAIHNAWDTVIHLVITESRLDSKEGDGATGQRHLEGEEAELDIKKKGVSQPTGTALPPPPR